MLRAPGAQQHTKRKPCPSFESGHSRSWAQLECIGGERRGPGVKSIFLCRGSQDRICHCGFSLHPHGFESNTFLGSYLEPGTLGRTRRRLTEAEINRNPVLGADVSLRLKSIETQSLELLIHREWVQESPG